MFRSLRLRIALSHAGVLALILLTLGGTGYVLLSRSLDRSATATTTAAANDVIEHIAESHRLDPPPDSDVPSSSTVRVALFRRNGAVVDERVDLPSWLRPQPTATVTERVGRERVRLVTERAYLNKRWVATVVAGLSLAARDQLLARVRLLLWLGGLAAILLSLTAGWLLAGRAVAPIRRAYEARSHFVADASHELRTPLTYIRSAVEMIAERVPDVGPDLMDEVDYLTKLTDRLLALARSDGGSLDLALVPVPVFEACREAARRNERALGLSVSVAPAEPMGGDDEREPVALADPVGLQAALDATLENAFRHGGRAAEIRASERTGRVLIQVVDHGPGLSAAEKTKVFERFHRVDSARSRQAGGAGLGLSLARSLLEAQRGRMWLEDTPAGGLTACLELPAAPAQPAPSSSSSSSSSSSTRPPLRQYTPRSRDRNPSSTR